MAILGRLLGDEIARTKVPDENYWSPVTQISLFDHLWDEIALIESFTLNWSRGVTPKRHLNAGDAGAIVGQIPAPENPVRATLTGVMLYNDPDSGDQIIGPMRLNPGQATDFDSLNDQGYYLNMGIICMHPTDTKKGGGFLLGKGLMDSYNLSGTLAGGGGTNEMPENMTVVFSYSLWVPQEDLGLPDTPLT